MSTEKHPIEVLCFRLGEEEYGVAILKVQEIRGQEAVTRIANAPDFIEGVINLRGIIVPIVDLRLRFGVALRTGQPRVVVILNIGHVIGMVVDSVSDVVRLAPGEIRPAPEVGGLFDADCLLGLGTVDDRMLILLDIDALMASGELGLIEPIAA